MLYTSPLPLPVITILLSSGNEGLQVQLLLLNTLHQAPLPLAGVVQNRCEQNVQLCRSFFASRGVWWTSAGRQRGCKTALAQQHTAAVHSKAAAEYIRAAAADSIATSQRAGMRYQEVSIGAFLHNWMLALSVHACTKL